LFLLGGFSKLENNASKYILVKHSPLWKKKKKKKKKKKRTKKKKKREILVNVSYSSMLHSRIICIKLILI
jgi:hypothetical protein